MAAVSVLGYKPLNSAVHNLDPRTKQLLVMVLSTACFLGQAYFLGLLSACILFCFVESRLGFVQIMGEISYFLLFLLFVFVVRAVTLSENFIPVLTLPDAQSAAVFCWRLLLVVLMGALLISTTRTAEIRAALVWGLQPLPFVNERAAATMVGLVVRLIPLILHQSVEIGEAMKARCIEQRRSPRYRLTRFTMLVFRRAFERADDLVDTMQARCYHEQRTLRTLRFSRNDALAAVIGLLVLSTLLLN